MTAATLRLQGELTIYAAQETRLLLLESLAALADADAQETLEVDVSDVTETDTAGIQILMAARLQARAMGKDVRLAGRNTAVNEVIGLLGLSAWFDGPVDAATTDADEA
jgi:anti-anti-sigma factor